MDKVKKFSDKSSRPMKRSLSVHEKESLSNISNDSKAIVLPSECNTEIEELLDVGFKPSNVHGFEINKSKFKSLACWYKDSKISNTDVFNYMACSNTKHNYIHLDLCNYLCQRKINRFQNWINVADSKCRLRITTYASRRKSNQRQTEAKVVEIIKEWCTMGVAFSDDPIHWMNLGNLVDDYKHDTTVVATALVMCNAMFGMTWQQYMNSVNGEPHLPYPQGRWKIESMSRFKYNEPNSPSVMYSVWWDLVPRDEDTSLEDMIDELQYVVSNSLTPLEKYTM